MRYRDGEGSFAQRGDRTIADAAPDPPDPRRGRDARPAWCVTKRPHAGVEGPAGTVTGGSSQPPDAKHARELASPTLRARDPDSSRPESHREVDPCQAPFRLSIPHAIEAGDMS